jgi:chromosome segregation ATPase
MGFFSKVSDCLPQIYRDLTRCEIAAAGGHASLLIMDRHETPFDSQIIFDFCPPGKRHGVDIDSLSGGEKTIAALAFVFALAQVKAPKLVVMDEVDAFLDMGNVQLVTGYLQQQKGKTQFLIVTHKEDLAQHTDSLVGVCMLKQH